MIRYAAKTAAIGQSTTTPKIYIKNPPFKSIKDEETDPSLDENNNLPPLIPLEPQHPP